MLVLVILLLAALVTAVGLGIVAKMPPRQIAGAWAAMVAAALFYYGLTSLL